MVNRRQFLAGTAAATASGLLTACGRDREVIRPAGVPLSPFGFESTAEEVTAGIDLGGKLALVTRGYAPLERLAPAIESYLRNELGEESARLICSIDDPTC